jgi:hypothetical protein
MNLNKQALLEFIKWVEDHADMLAPYEASVDLIRAIGFRCCIACKQRQESATVVITSLSPEKLDSIEIRVLSNIGPLAIQEYGMKQSGPNTYERGADFYFPMDEFELQIEWEGRQKSITIFGPHIARLAHSYLPDDSTPGIPVCDLVTVVSELLTKRRPEPVPYLGTRRNAEWKSIETAKILKSYISNSQE